MWDCKHRKEDDSCRRRKAVCYPGGVGCVLNGFDFPLRKEKDPLAVRLESKKRKIKSTRNLRQS